MTIHAYNELYLDDAKKCLGEMFDYAINICGQNPDWFAKLFVSSGLADKIEKGNPSVISGKAAEETVREMLKQIYPDDNYPNNIFNEEKTPEYWAGWILAQYQWLTAKRFSDIFDRVKLSKIISMYKLYHEMDVTRFFEALDNMCNEVVLETKLRSMRENRQVSQSELSKMSGVPLRSIQLYEQKVNNIDKAQAHTIYKLARALGCNTEDLLEEPEKMY